MTEQETIQNPQQAAWYVVHTYSGYENKVKDNLEKAAENNHAKPDPGSCCPGRSYRNQNGKRVITQHKAPWLCAGQNDHYQ